MGGVVIGLVVSHCKERWVCFEVNKVLKCRETFLNDPYMLVFDLEAKNKHILSLSLH